MLFRQISILISIILCIQNGAFSKSSINASLKSSVNLNVDATTLLYCSGYKNDIYVTKGQVDSASYLLDFVKYNLITQKKDSFQIYIYDSIPFYSGPSNFAFNDNYFIYMDDFEYNIYLFKMKNGKFNYANMIPLAKEFKAPKVLKALNDSLFLFYTIYNKSPLDSQPNTSIIIYNALRNEIKAIKPFSPCIGFTHITSELINGNTKFIALANPCNYSVHLYDLNLEPVKTISYQPASDWWPLKDDTIPCETNTYKVHPKTLIEKIISLADTISRIRELYFVNDTILMVSSSGKKYKEMRRIDLWNLNNTDKPFATLPKAAVLQDDAELISKDEYIINIGAYPYFNIYNNTISIVTDEGFLPDRPADKNRFKKMKNDYYEKINPYYTIQYFRLNY